MATFPSVYRQREGSIYPCQPSIWQRLGTLLGTIGQREGGEVKREIGIAVLLSQLLWGPGGWAITWVLALGTSILRAQWSQMDPGREEQPLRLCPDLRTLSV